MTALVAAAVGAEPPLHCVYRPPWPVDLRLTLGVLRRGRGDPTMRVDARADSSAVWRSARTPLGPATLRLQPRAGGEIAVAGWGPGAEWLVCAVPDLLGGRDRPEDFRPRHPLLRDLHRRLAGLRFPRTGLVFETLVPAVLEQKVTGLEARRSWQELLSRYGEPAPGPTPQRMRVFPPAAVWLRIPSWDWHRAGVDDKRARTVLAAAAAAERLERTADLADASARERLLRTVPGVGVWTAAEVAQRAFGDADAVSVGDFHVPSVVGWALLGRPIDDAEMLRVLAPYAPHRARAVRLLEVGGPAKPRFGPRHAGRDYRSI